MNLFHLLINKFFRWDLNRNISLTVNIGEYISPQVRCSRSYNLDIYIHLYTPGQKYKVTLKNEEKDIVYNF